MWAWKHRSVLEAGVRDSGGAFALVIANTQHIKRVPGRKTDVKDAEWIADLLVHGLMKASFVPPPAIRELRDLTRYRRKLVESQSAERNRLLKVLETANIKLASVASDVFGVSGQLMVAALVAGEATPRGDGGVGEGETAREASATGIGVGRKGGGTSPLPAAIATEALAGGGRRPRATRSAPARETGTVSGAGSAAAGDSWSGQHAGRHHHRGTWRRYERVSVAITNRRANAAVDESPRATYI